MEESPSLIVGRGFVGLIFNNAKSALCLVPSITSALYTSPDDVVTSIYEALSTTCELVNITPLLLIIHPVPLDNPSIN